MDELVSSTPAPQSAAEYETAIEQLLAEMKHFNQQMQSDRAEIEQLKLQTRTLKAETRAVLASMRVTL